MLLLFVEIPLFHVLNARVSFHNINGAEECPDGIVILEEDPTLKPPQTSTYDLEPGNEATGGGGEVDETPSKTCCIIDKSIFEVHEDYRDLGTDVNMYRSDSGMQIILIQLSDVPLLSLDSFRTYLSDVQIVYILYFYTYVLK